VIADHQHNHRQRQIIIVNRSLFARLAEFWVGQLTGQHRSDDLLLVRNNHPKHIGDHDRSDDRADLVESAASA